MLETIKCETCHDEHKLEQDCSWCGGTGEAPTHGLCANCNGKGSTIIKCPECWDDWYNEEPNL